MKTKLSIKLLSVGLLASACSFRATGQGTAFTYQGRLYEDSAPANGIYELRFALYDSTNSPGTLIAGPITNSAVAVSSGLFAVVLDFGGGVFDGASCWLEIAVRTNGAASGFVAINPRQPVTPTPYAISAANLLNPGTGPLDIKVGGQRVLRFEPNATSPNLIGGFSGNVVSTGVTGAAIGGGGAAAAEGTNGLNRITDNFGVVSGGAHNQAGNDNADLTDARYASIGGGFGNLATGLLSSIGGGSRNLASGISATVAGGSDNSATNNDAVVAGGFHNSAGYRAVAAGGERNTAGAQYSFVGGGFGNTVAGSFSVVAGGFQNLAGEGSSTISGGERNQILAAADHSVIAGGSDNTIAGALLSVYSVIGGGQYNTIQTNGGFATIGGGLRNVVQPGAHAATVSGGFGNIVGSAGSTISGGTSNLVAIGATNAFIGGGTFNAISGSGAVISGGGGASIVSGEAFTNRATDAHTVIAGGLGNLAGDEDLDPTNSRYASVGGGILNSASARAATVAGGSDNTIGAGSDASNIAGGEGNTISSNAVVNVIAGGNINVIESGAGLSFIGGGYHNQIRSNAAYSAVSGGDANVVESWTRSGYIGGGYANSCYGDFGTVGGGSNNTCAAFGGVIAGGQFNLCTMLNSTVGGGRDNIADGSFSTVPGGFANAASGESSFAAGNRAHASHAGSFVWADLQNADFTSTTSNEFSIRASGGVRLSDDTPALSFGSATRQMFNLWSTNYGIGVQGGALYFRTDASFSPAGFSWFKGGSHNDTQWDAGGGTELMRLDGGGNLRTYTGTIAALSDRNAKTKFEPVDTSNILEKVVSLPVSRWSFKNADIAQRHIGPMAQDFYSAFEVGLDDKSICTVDADGVALAAIQGLNQKLEQQMEQKDSEIAKLNQKVDQLTQLIRVMNKRLNGGTQ